MQPYDFEKSVGFWITITSHYYQQLLNEELAPVNITLRQFQVMAWLIVDGELSPCELAKRLMIERPTLGGILDRMQREDWIERISSEHDRRMKQIRLKPGAQQVWERVVGCLMRMRHRATAGMSDAEIGTLIDLLGRVQRNLAAEQAGVPDYSHVGDTQFEAHETE